MSKAFWPTSMEQKYLFPEVEQLTGFIDAKFVSDKEKHEFPWNCCINPVLFRDWAEHIPLHAIVPMVSNRELS
jgi:hypothetical protein